MRMYVKSANQYYSMDRIYAKAVELSEDDFDII